MATRATSAAPEEAVVNDAQFRLLADHLPTLCWYGRADGTVIWYNRRWHDYTGIEPGVLAAQGWQSVHDPARLAEVVEQIRPAFEAGEPFDLIIHLRGADGVFRPFLSHAQPVDDPGQGQRCWVGTCTEITAQLEAERRQAFLLRLGDRVRDATDAEAILGIAAADLGAELGVDRVVYAVVDWDRRIMHVNRDWRADGEPHPPYEVGLDVFGPAYLKTHVNGEPLASADVVTDDRVLAGLRAHFLANGTRAFLSVPLVKNGRLAAVMSVQHGSVRPWMPAEVQLLGEVAERTWATLERARVQGDLAVAQQRQGFLLALGDRLRAEADPAKILAASAQALGEHFHARHVIYSEVGDSQAHLDIKYGWSDGSMPARSGRWPLSLLGDEIVADYCAGETIAIDDIDEATRLPEALREGFRAQGVRAYLTVPMCKHDRLVALLSVQVAEPHVWTHSDIEIAEAVAERSWEALERARAEEALRESEALFRGVTEAHPVPVVIAQGEGLVLGNAAFFEMAGVAKGDLVAVDPKVWAGWGGRWDELVTFVRAHPRYDNYETTMVRDGRPFPVSMSWRHISYRGAPAVVASLIDLSEIRRTQSELQRSREALHQAEKLSALGSLLAGVSHELNNPLSVVTTQAMLLEDLAEGSALADRAAKVRNAAERCSRIVQTFLAMARQKRPERQLVSAADLVRSALNLTDYALRTAGIRVTVEITPGLPELSADPDQLHQVLVNLIVNAQHALQEISGPRELQVRVRAADEPGRLSIEVEDNGPGIPDEIRRRVFEPFFTTKPQGVGTGVGLSFSLGIVEAHGGRLELLDGRHGTCFRITLAAAETAPTRGVVAATINDASAPHEGSALVIDDEPDLAEALAIFIGRAGYRVDTAADGLEAQRLLEGADYDAIVSDLRMPGLDGPALYDWIERHRPQLVRRIGFVTGDTLGASAARFIGRTGRPVIEKPFTPESVRALVEQLDEHRSARPKPLQGAEP